MMDSQDYQNLREEIMYSRKAQDKFTIFMYTSVATIIGFAIQFQNAYLFLLPLIITFPFSIKIADYRRTIANLAAYMIVFLENNDKCHWETDNYNIENDFGCKPKVKVSRNRFEVFIHSLNNYDSLIISLFCTAVFFYYKFKNPDLHTVFKILIKTGIFSAYIDDLESSIYQIRAIQQ